MPASMPIAHQRIVRGEAVRRLPGQITGGGSFPTFSWPGTVNFLDISPPWPVIADASYTSLVLVMADGTAAIDIDVLVNGSVADSVAASATATQTLAITVAVTAGDYIQLELTDDGAGTAVNIGVVLT
jgi:hypothetical protein